MRTEYAGGERLTNRSKRKFLKLLSFTVLLILLVETGRVFLGIWIEKPVVSQWGTIEKGCWMEALFLRNETTIKSPISGSLVQKVEDGIRIPKETVVASLAPGFGILGGTDHTFLRLVQRLQTLLAEEESLMMELKRVNGEISNKKRQLSRSLQLASEINEDLKSLEQEKEQVFRNITNVRAKILKARINLKNRHDSIEFIPAAETGYVFFQYDDLEGKLTPDHFYKLTEEDFKMKYILKSSGNRIKNGATIGKIVSPFNQLIVIMIDTERIKAPGTGDTWWLKTPDGLNAVMVKGNIPLADHNQIIALNDSGISQYYMPERRAKIFIVYKRVTGVIVPTQALHKKGHQIAVKLRKGDGYKLQEVQVLETDGDKAVIEGIDFGTTIISR